MAGSTDRARTAWLVIFVKEPRPGQVKTRLARETGFVRAAHWHRHQCLAIIRRLSTDPRWQTLLAVTPDMEGLNSRIWPGDLPRVGQGVGNLGVRMARIMRVLPPGPVVIIGSDIPGATSSRVGMAFKLLGRKDAVFGPSPDGGYWLVGLKRIRAVSARTFEGVRWSSKSTLSDSLASLDLGSIGFADTLQDVDTVQDLKTAESKARHH